MPVHCGAVDAKAALGAGKIVTVSVNVLEQKASAIVNETTLSPDELYTTPAGLSWAEVAGLACR